MSNNSFDLSKKTVVVTGAAGLLGTEYSQALIKSGANLVLADLNFSKCKELSNILNEKNSNKSIPIKLDVTKQKSIKSLVMKTMKRFGSIDVLINNAANQGNKSIRQKNFEDFSLAEWNKEISVNLTGVFLCC